MVLGEQGRDSAIHIHVCNVSQENVHVYNGKKSMNYIFKIIKPMKIMIQFIKTH